MKIQCNVCEAAEANVLCCADEAALCWGCDQKVHAANKLASKHQRVPLSTSSSQMPKCDICQESFGYFFCLEDRALLCRKCDVAIHTANSLVSVHQRFLLTGVKVGLETTENTPSPSSEKIHSQSNDKISGPDEPRSLPKRTTPVSSTGQDSRNMPVQASVGGDFSSSMLPFTGGSAPWQLDEFLELGDYNQNYNQNYSFMDHGSSKADNGKLGDSDCSPGLRAADGDIDGDYDQMGQVPDTFWTVPEIPSPPTASGLNWPRKSHNLYDSNVFVPDIGSSPLSNFQYRLSHGDISKRRRRS